LSVTTIAVVVPVFNEGDGIAQHVRTLLTDFDFEHVVVVDASDDISAKAAIEKMTAEFQAEYDRLTVITSALPGRALQMNRGAQACTTDVLLFLHADTRLPEDAVTKIRKEIEDGHQWGRFDVRLDASGLIFRIIEWSMNLRSAISGVATGDQGIFVTKELFESVGGFAEIPVMEDIELSRRLKNISWPTRIRFKVTTSARRWQQQGVICTVLQMWSLRLQYWLGVSPEKLLAAYRNIRN